MTVVSIRHRRIGSVTGYAPFVFLITSAWLGHVPERSEWYVVGVSGIEPETSSLSVTRSNHLSYTPAILA